MKKIFKGILLLLALTFIFSVFTVSAQTVANKSTINLASPLYFIKATFETFQIKATKAPVEKALRHFEYATKRIYEAQSLVGSPKEYLIEPTLVWYIFHIKEFKNISLIKEYEYLLIQNSQILSEQMTLLQDIYDQTKDNRAQIALRSTIYQLTKITRSKLSGCQFLEKIASSSALNDVEKVVYTKRANECLNTN